MQKLMNYILDPIAHWLINHLTKPAYENTLRSRLPEEKLKTILQPGMCFFSKKIANRYFDSIFNIIDSKGRC